MNRTEFIRELEYLLQDISDEDREDAVAYYRDYLEDAGEDHEEDAIRELGSPERVAAIIRADLNGQMKDGGTFTDSGYQDERFRDPRYQVARRRDLPDIQETQGADEKDKKQKAEDFVRHMRSRWADARGSADSVPPRRTFARVLRVILLVVLLFVAGPILTGIGGGMIGIVFGLAALMAVVLALTGVLTIAALLGGAALLVLGICMTMTEFWSGVLCIGGGILALGLGFLGLALSVLVYGKLIPWCIRGIVDVISRFLHRGRRQSV